MKKLVRMVAVVTDDDKHKFQKVCSLEDMQLALTEHEDDTSEHKEYNKRKLAWMQKIARKLIKRGDAKALSLVTLEPVSFEPIETDGEEEARSEDCSMCGKDLKEQENKMIIQGIESLREALHDQFGGLDVGVLGLPEKYTTFLKKLKEII